MLRIEVVRTKPGMRLALPVGNPQEPLRTLLNRDYELTDAVIRRLCECGIRSVWVRYPSLEFLERYMDMETIQVQNEVVSQIASTFETLQNEATAKLRYDTYTESLQQLVDYLTSHPQAAMFLGDLADVNNDMMRHSASVTYLALLMGMKLEGYLVRERKHVNPGRAKEVTNLGLGAMLHDVGVMQLDPHVRRQHEQTGDESDADWQEHPALGFHLVRGHVDPSAATIVLNHHQRHDGSGYAGSDYPLLREKRVHVFARVAAVADQFDRMRHPAHLPDQPTVWVLSAMFSEPLRSRFDPHVLRALLSVVPPYPPGSMVRLSDGQTAVCIDHHPHEPCRPTVQIIPDPEQFHTDNTAAGPTVDLSQAPPELAVVEHEGHDVRELNFEPPDFAAELAGQHAWL